MAGMNPVWISLLQNPLISLLLKALINKACFHRQSVFFPSAHLQCSVQGYSSFGTTWTHMQEGWRHERPHVHEMTMPPDCFPSMRSLHESLPATRSSENSPATVLSFSHSLISFIHLFTIVSYSSIYHFVLLSVETLCVSLVSQNHGGCVPRPGGIAPHNTHLAADPQDSKATKTPTEPWQVQGTGFIQIVK